MQIREDFNQTSELIQTQVVQEDEDIVLPRISEPGISGLPEAPFPDLLLSNNPPSPSEITDILKVISEAEVLESSLKSAIVEEEEIAQEMVTLRKIESVENFIAAHKGILSAARRIPPEIVQEILEWVGLMLCRDAEYCRMNPSPAFRWVPPWAFGHISHSWRLSALSTQSLWNYFPELSLPETQTKTARQVEYVREFLRRSRNSPIQFSIELRAGVRYPVTDVLVEVAERWSIVDIYAREQSIHAFRDVRGRLPLLRSLDLDLPVATPLSRNLHLNIFEHAPMLQKVTVSGNFPERIKLPYHQLISFEHSGRAPRNPLSQLANAILLENLTLKNIVNSVPAITLPRLTKLRVYFKNAAFSIFDSLTLPSITDIWMQSWWKDMDEDFFISLASMISRPESPCPLHRIHIYSNVDGMPLGLGDVLRQTPVLASLTTPIPHPEDILTLASSHPQHPPAPHLEICEFYVVATPGRDITQALNCLAAARCEPELLECEGGGTRSLRSQDLWRLKRLCVRNITEYLWTNVQRPWHMERVGIIKQSHFEHWSETYVPLAKLGERLLGYLPELAEGKRSWMASRPQLTNEWSGGLQKVLSDIENLVVFDGKDILVRSPLPPDNHGDR